MDKFGACEDIRDYQRMPKDDMGQAIWTLFRADGHTPPFQSKDIMAIAVKYTMSEKAAGELENFRDMEVQQYGRQASVYDGEGGPVAIPDRVQIFFSLVMFLATFVMSDSIRAERAALRRLRELERHLDNIVKEIREFYMQNRGIGELDAFKVEFYRRFNRDTKEWSVKMLEIAMQMWRRCHHVPQADEVPPSPMPQFRGVEQWLDVAPMQLSMIRLRRLESAKEREEEEKAMASKSSETEERERRGKKRRRAVPRARARLLP